MRLASPFRFQLCWDCFNDPPPSEAHALRLMTKTKARNTFLLTDKDFQKLPCVIYGGRRKPLSSVHMVAMAQAEALAISKYPDGMQGEAFRQALYQAEAERGDRLLSSYPSDPLRPASRLAGREAEAKGPRRAEVQRGDQGPPKQGTRRPAFRTQVVSLRLKAAGLIAPSSSFS